MEGTSPTALSVTAESELSRIHFYPGFFPNLLEQPPQEKLHMITEIVRSLIFYLSYRKWSSSYNIKPSTDPAQADHNYTSVSLSILCVVINPRFKEYMGI